MIAPLIWLHAISQHKIVLMPNGLWRASSAGLAPTRATILVYNSCMLEKQPPTNITIRIPAEIAEMLRKLAKQHDRSLNGEIVRALREYTEKHRERQP